MDDIVEIARRAEGSDLLPKVSFGLMNAEQLILRMADTIEAMRARVAELEDQIGSAMMDGHDMAKNEYRDIISGLEARVAELSPPLSAP